MNNQSCAPANAKCPRCYKVCEMDKMVVGYWSEGDKIEILCSDCYCWLGLWTLARPDFIAAIPADAWVKTLR